jgi:hypothetical protein
MGRSKPIVRFPRLIISMRSYTHNTNKTPPPPPSESKQQLFHRHLQQQQQCRNVQTTVLKLEDAVTLVPTIPVPTLITTLDGRQVSLASSCSSSSSSSKTNRTVTFGDCHVRSYAQVLGDHPYCSMGCPLSLGWDYQQEPPSSIDAHNLPHAENQDLRLTWQERKAILETSTGELELRKASRKTCRERSQVCRRQARKEQRHFFACPTKEATL